MLRYYRVVALWDLALFFLLLLNRKLFRPCLRIWTCSRGIVSKMSLHRLIRSYATLVGGAVGVWQGQAMKEGARWMIMINSIICKSCGGHVVLYLCYHYSLTDTDMIPASRGSKRCRAM